MVSLGGLWKGCGDEEWGRLTSFNQVLASSSDQPSGSPLGSGFGADLVAELEEDEEEVMGEEDCCCWGKMSVPQME